MLVIQPALLTKILALGDLSFLSWNLCSHLTISQVNKFSKYFRKLVSYKRSLAPSQKQSRIVVRLLAPRHRRLLISCVQPAPRHRRLLISCVLPVPSLSGLQIPERFPKKRTQNIVVIFKVPTGYEQPSYSLPKHNPGVLAPLSSPFLTTTL